MKLASASVPVLVAALLAAVLVPACGGGGGGAGAESPERVVPVRVTERFAGLEIPWGLAFLPDASILVTERPGRLKLISPDGRTASEISGVPAVVAVRQGGLLDVVIDPDFALNNRIYLSFSEADATDPARNGTAVARAELDVATFSLRNVTVIYRQLPKVESVRHFGSRLVFDRDGYLFVTMGERAHSVMSQDLAVGHGKVAHITREGAPAPNNPRWSAAGAQPHFWSYGHRNPQGAALHPVTGELWESEHGPAGGDEINRVRPGRNYGWPVVSLGHRYGTTRPVGVPTRPDMEDPAWSWITEDGSPYVSGEKSSTAPAGMTFYSGDSVPQWRGNLFVTALAGQSLWRLTLDGNRVVSQERLLASLRERMRDVEQGPDGALYILTDSGRLLRYGP